MFKDRLKELRKSNGYTMDELCDLYNKKYNGKMNKSTLSRYENGLQEPMLTVVRNLADLFNVSIDYMSDDSQVITPAEALEKLRQGKGRANTFVLMGSGGDGGQDIVQMSEDEYNAVKTVLDTMRRTKRKSRKEDNE